MRVLGRLVRVAAVTAVLYPLFVLGLVVLAPFARARRRWRGWIVRHWHAQACAALQVRVEVRGPPPPAGAFVVSNHLSYLDINVLGAVLRTRFVSKSEVARWPVIGFLASTTGTVYVERQRKRQLSAVNDAIRAALAQGDGVVAFPEGTSTRGDGVLPFKPSLLAPAAEQGGPVHCATLHYATAPGDPPASTAVAWWGDMAFMPHLAGLLKLERIDATLTFHPSSVQAHDRKALAGQARDAVLASFRRLD